MDDIAISVNNLSKFYRLYQKPIDRLKESLDIFKKEYSQKFYALDDISFKVRKGETLGIIGKNGSGKSTLLKIITGVLTQSGGSVEVNGKIAALLELGTGFNFEMTGMENIYFNGTIMGYTRSEIDERVDEIVNFADIGAFIHQPVKTYSSGMFVRLAFAVSINVEPDILIVDEALSVGDMFFQLKCYKKFNEFKEKGKTIIFVTHDLGSVLKYCDRTIVINEGHKVAEGDSKEMVDVYKKILVNLDIDKENAIVENNEKLVSFNISKIELKKNMMINPNHSSYGDMSAEIIDYGIMDDKKQFSQVLIKNNEYVFRMRVKLNKNLKEPIFAMTVKDIKGNELYGTNTMIEMTNVGIIEKGKIVEVGFRHKINIQGGNYFISFGCTGFTTAGEFVVYHRLYDLIGFEVVSSKNTVGLFDSNIEIDFKDW